MNKKIEECTARLIINDLNNMSEKDFNRLIKWSKELTTKIKKFRKLRVIKRFSMSLIKPRII